MSKTLVRSVSSPLAPTTRAFAAGATSDSVEARNRVPIRTPSAAEHQRCGQPTAIGDPAGRNDQDLAARLRSHVGHGWHQRKSRAPAAMAARLAALRDDHVRALVQHLARLSDILNLTDD